MKKSFWILATIGAALGLLILLTIEVSGKGSPIEQIGAKIFCIGMAVIPYCLARAISEIYSIGKENKL